MHAVTRVIFSFLLAVALVVPFTNSIACGCGATPTIDSLPQLAQYEFIAHVRITSLGETPDEEIKPGAIGEVSFEILELFKGEKSYKMIDEDRYTSCDMMIKKGEEWILFGKKREDKIGIFACDRNVLYRWRNKMRNWENGNGLRELEKLRQLYGHPSMLFSKKTRKLFYPGGKVELEEIYVNSKLNGERKLWYPNGQLYGREYYINDTLDGKAEWFYPTGQIKERNYYLNGVKYQVARRYYDTSIRSVYTNNRLLHDKLRGRNRGRARTGREKICLESEMVFDSQGRALIVKYYHYDGTLSEEYIIDPEHDRSTSIEYHQNGTISAIKYFSGYKITGTYQTYDTAGRPLRKWNYD